MAKPRYDRAEYQVQREMEAIMKKNYSKGLVSLNKVLIMKIAQIINSQT